MDKNVALLLAIIAGTSFGSWPNIPSSSPVKIPPYMVTFFIAMGLCVVAIIQFSISKTSSLAEAQSIASSTALKYLLLSVMFNSIGYLAYTPLIAAPKEFNVSIYIIIALVVTPLASYAYSVLFQNGTITVKNLLCIGAIVAGIIGLKMK